MCTIFICHKISIFFLTVRYTPTCLLPQLPLVLDRDMSLLLKLKGSILHPAKVMEQEKDCVLAKHTTVSSLP